jgi:hypothetical protein
VQPAVGDVGDQQSDRIGAAVDGADPAHARFTFISR